MQNLPFTAKRIIIAVVLAIAFVCMASVFSPDLTTAGDYDSHPTTRTAPRAANYDEYASTDPHEGLASLGSLESATYAVHIYSTQVGARYSVYEKSTGLLIGTLLTADQINQQFPELQLPSSDFSANTVQKFMLADPAPHHAGP